MTTFDVVSITHLPSRVWIVQPHAPGDFHIVFATPEGFSCCCGDGTGCRYILAAVESANDTMMRRLCGVLA